MDTHWGSLCVDVIWKSYYPSDAKEIVLVIYGLFFIFLLYIEY